MKNFSTVFPLFIFFLTAPITAESFVLSEGNTLLPAGYGGIELGMSVDEVKNALKKNSEFGYNGDRDVSLLPGENRILIETDAAAGHTYTYLERCWFQFYKDKLYIITITLNTERIDHYSVFNALCKKYGNPEILSPEKSTWKNDSVTMSLENPLSLKYVDNKTFDAIRDQALVGPSGREMSRNEFLEGL
jgi:hypothetical protein